MRAADGRAWSADQVLVCSGTDTQTLFPQHFQSSGTRLCKLRMLRTAPQPSAWRLGPHLASGLTLRHYKSFEACPSLNQLRQRVAAETPELDRYGIHVMAAQNQTGHVLLGDSHEYGDEVTPFDHSEIEHLILREVQRQFSLPDWNIEARWHGCYLKQPEQALVRIEVEPGIEICLSPGGAGMTLSLGWAERYWLERTACSDVP